MFYMGISLDSFATDRPELIRCGHRMYVFRINLLGFFH